MLLLRMTLNVSMHCGSNAALEGLKRLEDYRRTGFVGQRSYGQAFKHESGHWAEIFAVKVAPFPKIARVGREENDKKMAESFERKWSTSIGRRTYWEKWIMSVSMIKLNRIQLKGSLAIRTSSTPNLPLYRRVEQS